MSSTQSNKLKAAQWFAHVEQWRASDLTRSAYCQQHGIAVHALGYWVMRHRTQTAADGALTLVPAAVTGEPPSALVLHCPNGSQLHLPATTPAAWLGALLSQLR
jgi:hypothetical protein